MNGSRKMKIVINIPKEFEGDYCKDKFKEYFLRVKHDVAPFNIGVSIKPTYACGNYELETHEMLMKVFEESEQI